MIRPRDRSRAHSGTPEADRLWLLRAWDNAWMEPPSWAADLILRPTAHWNGDSGGNGRDDQQRRCFVWSRGRFWVRYRWMLQDGRWLHAKVPTSPFAAQGATFSWSEEEKPEDRLPAYQLHEFPVQALRPAELQKGPAGPQRKNPRGPAGPAQQLQLL